MAIRWNLIIPIVLLRSADVIFLFFPRIFFPAFTKKMHLPLNVFVLYLYIVAALATLLIFKSCLVAALKFLLYPSGPAADFVSRHILLPHLFRRRSLWGPMTRIRAFLHAAHLAATFACNIIGVEDISTARSRAGSLATLHIASLAVFSQLTFGAALLNISLPTQQHLHASVGVMGVFQSLLHVIFALQAISFDLRVTIQRYGFAVSSRKCFTLLILC